MAVMETLHNTVPEESRIYVVFVLVILWDVRLNVGAKLIDGDASVMTVCIVYGVWCFVASIKDGIGFR